ncbi:MAG: polyamine ABC transporter substrate-binding protein [Gammaproteobacteria bacterium]
MPSSPCPFALCLVAAMAAAPLVPAAAEEERILNIYNWADYIGRTTIADFEHEFAIKVNYDIYDSAEVVDTKLMAGLSGYDVVMHSATFTHRLLPAGIFRPLDRSRLPNWKHLDPKLLALFDSFDAGMRYSAPYMWGTLGFSYNVDMVRERLPDAPLDSAAFVFEPENAARFADCGVTLLDSPTDVIPTAMLYLGHEANSVDPAELKEAETLLKAIRPYVKYFDSTKMLIDMPNKEVCVAMSWSGDYSVAWTRAREAGIDINLAYMVPKEGVPIWLDAAYIPADAPHPDNAHQFIDYLLRPEVIAAISNFTGYANANRSATPLVKPEYTGNPAIYPDADILKRLHTSTVKPPKIERLRSRTWTRVKTGL